MNVIKAKVLSIIRYQGDINTKHNMCECATRHWLTREAIQLPIRVAENF